MEYTASLLSLGNEQPPETSTAISSVWQKLLEEDVLCDPFALKSAWKHCVLEDITSFSLASNIFLKCITLISSNTFSNTFYMAKALRQSLAVSWS